MRTPRRTLRPFLVVFALLLLPVCASAAGNTVRNEAQELLTSYVELRARLERNAFGIPLFVDSTEKGRTLTADAYGVFDHPFESVADALKTPSNWADIATLHPNVKASTYSRASGEWLLTFYCGRKFYQSPDAAHRLTFSYRPVQQRRDYLKIVLRAGSGPYGTKDHDMTFEAVPIDARRTFVHVSYGYSYGASLRVAEKVYFSTLGREKVGFTVTGTDARGNPTYIGGPRGAIERNAVRYYFAIQSFLDAEGQPEEQRFVARVAGWYDLTHRFKKQLFEMEKDAYVRQKFEERQQQVTLQEKASAAADAPAKAARAG